MAFRAALVLGCVLYLSHRTVEGRDALYGADDDDITKCRTDVCNTPAASNEYVKYVNTRDAVEGAGSNDDPHFENLVNYDAPQSGLGIKGNFRTNAGDSKGRIRVATTRPFISGATG